MNPFDAIEGWCEDLVDGARARMGEPLQPLTIARRLAAQMRAHVEYLPDRYVVPNRYRVRLAPADIARFAAYLGALQRELAASLSAEARRNGLSFISPPLVELVADGRVRRGGMRIDSAVAEPGREPLRWWSWGRVPRASTRRRTGPTIRTIRRGQGTRGTRLRALAPAAAIVLGSALALGPGNAASDSLVDAAASTARGAAGAIAEIADVLLGGVPAAAPLSVIISPPAYSPSAPLRSIVPPVPPATAGRTSGTSPQQPVPAPAAVSAPIASAQQVTWTWGESGRILTGIEGALATISRLQTERGSYLSSGQCVGPDSHAVRGNGALVICINTVTSPQEVRFQADANHAYYNFADARPEEMLLDRCLGIWGPDNGYPQRVVVGLWVNGRFSAERELARSCALLQA